MIDSSTKFGYLQGKCLELSPTRISSIETLVKMHHQAPLIRDFPQKFRKYSILFYILGQGIWIHSKPTGKSANFKQIWHLFPAIVCILIIILYLTCACIFCWLNLQFLNIKQMTFLSVTITLPFIVSMIIYWQCITQMSALNDVSLHICFLTTYFRNKFQYEISFKEFSREVRQDFVKTLLLFLGGLFYFVIAKICDIHEPFGIVVVFLMLIPSVIGMLHSTFYINLFKYIMSQLNILVKQEHICRTCKQMKSNRRRSSAWNHFCRRNSCDEIRLTALKSMKLIYYRLWRAVRHANDFFGTAIAAIILQNFILASYALFWGYSRLSVTEHVHDINFRIIGPFICTLVPTIFTAILIESAHKLYTQVICPFTAEFEFTEKCSWTDVSVQIYKPTEHDRTISYTIRNFRLVCWRKMWKSTILPSDQTPHYIISSRISYAKSNTVPSWLPPMDSLLSTAKWCLLCVTLALFRFVCEYSWIFQCLFNRSYRLASPVRLFWSISIKWNENNSHLLISTVCSSNVSSGIDEIWWEYVSIELRRDRIQ